MKIQEIRDFLKANPQYYSANNIDDIDTLRSNYQYSFVADCGHEFTSLPTNVFVDNQLHCPICSGRRVLRGVNDLWTTYPEYAELLANSNDGYKYSYGSNKKLYWRCPYCDELIYQSPNKFISRKTLCNKCHGGASYGERFVSNFLQQLCESFEPEKIFDWSENKRYDFYLPTRNLIIEVHGKQHYSNSDFSYFGGRTYSEEQENDKYKKDLAIKNKIANYVVINASVAEQSFLKKSIMCSLLPTILDFRKDDIDWDECHQMSLKNIVKDVCDKYNEGQTNIKKLVDIFGKSPNTIKGYLKTGAKMGWCEYDPQKAIEKCRKANGARIVATMSKPIIQMDLNGNDLREFSSIQSAQRELGICKIWDCLVGRRMSAGGFKWRYKDTQTEREDC
jgi:DNA-directed RNA polymerase subunit RPC12/RpoP